MLMQEGGRAAHLYPKNCTLSVQCRRKMVSREGGTETENRHDGFQLCSKTTNELWTESASK